MQFTDGSVHQLLILKIATLQTEYFSKPCQNPVFSHLENAENDSEEGPSRGARFFSAERNHRPVNAREPKSG